MKAAPWRLVDREDVWPQQRKRCGRDTLCRLDDGEFLQLNFLQEHPVCREACVSLQSATGHATHCPRGQRGRLRRRRARPAPWQPDGRRRSWTCVRGAAVQILHLIKAQWKEKGCGAFWNYGAKPDPADPVSSRLSHRDAVFKLHSVRRHTASSRVEVWS